MLEVLSQLLSQQGGHFAKTKTGEIIPIQQASEGDTLVIISDEDVKNKKLMQLFGKEKIGTGEYRLFQGVVTMLEEFVNSNTGSVLKSRLRK